MTTRVRSVSGIQKGVQLDMSNPTGLKQSPIIQALTYNAKGDCMEILAKYAGLEYDKKYHFLLRGSQQVTLSEVFRFYGVLTTAIKCPHCLEGVGIDLIFLHLQHNFQNRGHRLTNNQVIQFFLDEESGKNVDIIWKKNNKPR